MDFNYSASSQHRLWTIPFETITARKRSADTYFEEEDLILCYFCNQILGCLGTIPSSAGNVPVLKKHWRVGCTAVSYFRRFYVNNSILHHDPRLLMLASVLLAGKTEDSFILMKDLMTIYGRYSDTDILSAEVLLVQSMDFDLKVFHPYNCLPALISDFKQFVQGHLSHSHPVADPAVQTSGGGGRDGGRSGDMEVDPNSTVYSAEAKGCEEDATSSNDGGGGGGPSGLEETKKRHSELAATWLLRAQRAVLAIQVTNAILCHRPLVIALCAMKVTESEEWPRSMEMYIKSRFAGVSILSELNSIYIHFLSTPQNSLSSEELATQVMASMKKLKFSQQWKR